MADQKVTELPSATAVTSADIAYVVQGGNSKQMTLEVLRRLAPNTPTAVFGDGNSTESLEAGLTCFVRVPYGGTIVEWGLVANASCTCVVDVWKNTTLPTNANSITASAKPSLSGATVADSDTLTGWDTDVVEGDILGFELESVSGSASQITLTLKVV